MSDTTPRFYKNVQRLLGGVLAIALAVLGVDTYKKVTSDKEGVSYGLIVDDYGAVTGVEKIQRHFTAAFPGKPYLQTSDHIVQTKYLTAAGQVCVVTSTNRFVAPIPFALLSKDYPWDGVCRSMTRADVAEASTMLTKVPAADRPSVKNIVWKPGLAPKVVAGGG